MARTYRRDAKGRFASGGSARSARQGPASPAKGRAKGSAPPRRKGLVTQRRAVAAAKGKLAAKDPADQSIKGALSRRAQKGAVTRAKNKLKAAKEAGRVKLPKKTGAVSVGKPKGVKAKAKPVGWMQSPEARADRTNPISSKDRKDTAKRLRAMPKTARRAIAVESLARRRRDAGTGDSTMDRYITAISQGRMQLASDYKKRKNKLSLRQRQAIAASMERSASKLRLLLKGSLKGAPLPTSRVLPKGKRKTAKLPKMKGAMTFGKSKRNPKTSASASRKPSPGQPKRKDQAVVNIPMRGARGKALERDISNAVKQVQAISKAKMKPASRVRAEQKQLKSLRAAHEPDMIAALKRRTGRSTAEIRSTLRARLPHEEIALLRRWVKEKRNNPEVLKARKARADKKRAPK